MSSSTASADWVAVALLGKPRGNRGELTAVSLSSKPERFASLGEVRLVATNDESRTAVVESVWDHAGTLIFKFRGVDSINAAEELRGAEVHIPKSERVELEAGEYFLDDLIGCEVRDHLTDKSYGKVTSYEDYGGPVLLDLDDGRMMIPFVKAICVDIRPADHVIRVDLPIGLDTLEQPDSSPPE